MFKGYSSQLKLDGDPVEYATVEPIRKEQNGITVLAHQFVRFINSFTAGEGSGERKIVAVGHDAEKGDIIVTQAGREIKVRSVEEDIIYVVDKVEFAKGDGIDVYRHQYPRVNVSGAVQVEGTFAAGAIGFIDRTGSNAQVSEPLNRAAKDTTNPLPVRQEANFNGSVVNDTLADTTAKTVNPPDQAIGFILTAAETNEQIISWAIGSTASPTVGSQLETSRSTGFIPCAAPISICAKVGGANAFIVQWILKR